MNKANELGIISFVSKSAAVKYILCVRLSNAIVLAPTFVYNSSSTLYSSFDFCIIIVKKPSPPEQNIVCSCLSK